MGPSQADVDASDGTAEEPAEVEAASPSDRVQRHRRIWATAAGLTVGGIAYYLTLLDYSTKLTRTANSLGYASNFFDFQGRAFLDGRLDVPRGSLGIEGFIIGDKEYMYFPPFPSLLRLPVLMTTHEFDGKLTLLSMGLAFVLMAVMTAKLTWLVRDCMCGNAEVTRYEAVSVAVFLALATGGSVLTYNASLPWVYHEVYAWAVPLVIGAMYWMIRVQREPSRKTIGWLAAFALCSIMTRTTGGWAVCLAAIGLGAWVLLNRPPARQRPLCWGVIAAGAVPLLAGVAYNWVKFKHPYLFPLEDQVWTQVNEHRQEALKANGGTITGPQFLPTAWTSYFRPDGIRFVEYFPWITLPAEPVEPVGNTVIDQSYRTGSVPAFMPGLFLLTCAALPALLARRIHHEIRMLRAPFIAGLLVTGGVMAYGYFAYRYTCEFVPMLVIGGAIGQTALTAWVDTRGRLLKGIGLTLLVILTGFSIAANMLTGFTASALTRGGASLERYLEVQERLSGNEQRSLVSTTDAYPTGGNADEIRIVGDCDELYLNTGDTYEPWKLVQRRGTVVSITLDPDVQPIRVPLIEVNTELKRTVWLDTNRRHQARIVIRSERGLQRGQWFEVPPPYKLSVGVLDKPELGHAEVQSTPGGFVGYVRTFDWDSNWVAQPTRIEIVESGRQRALRAGIAIRPGLGLAPSLCTRLQADVTGQ